MNTEDIASVTTNRLVELFVDAAKRFGMGSGMLTSLRRIRDPRIPKPAENLEEQKAAAEQLWKTSTALCARHPIAQAERLLEDNDPDIRATAAAFLGDLSPELAAAAGKAYLVDLPTREVLALQRRARQAPPERPTIAEMSDDELVARFEDAAQRECGAGFLDDDDEMDLHNAIVGEVWDIMRELKGRGQLARLLPLVHNDNITVRREAATACLRIAEAQAVETLESVARDGIFGEGFAASQALARWRQDGSIVYGV
jgi:hypothetical protein